MGLFDRKRRREDDEAREPPPADPPLNPINTVEAHIARHYGKPFGVLRQSDAENAIAMHVMAAGDDRPRATVITSGMSRRPMPGAPSSYARAELLLSLPPDWPLEMSAMEDERHWWPLRLLQNLSHMPLNTGGWLGFGHLVPHGGPYAPNTTFCAALLLPPVWTPDDFTTLETGDIPIRFFGVYVLHPDEVRYHQEHGTEATFERFRQAQVSEQLDLSRPSAV
jgi:hypothetical protein